MSENEQALKMIRRWAAKIGNKKAIKRLHDAKLGYSTASQMVAGTYTRTPNDLTASVLLKEMAKDGFTLAGDKAS